MPFVNRHSQTSLALNKTVICFAIVSAADFIDTLLTLVPHERCYTYVFIRASSIFVLLASFIPLGDFLHNG
jgi:phage-related holin